MMHRQRFFEDNLREPLVDKLFTSLNKRISSKRNYKVGCQEVDCVSVTDKYIFLFEVKNTFIPCNYAEERTTYDHILKSSKQLSRAKSELAKTSVQKKIETDFECNNVVTKHVYTCTIFGNRVLTGYKVAGHSVRYIAEATNFLDTGKGFDGKKPFSMWKCDGSFSEDDLAWFVEAGGTNCKLVDQCKYAPDIYAIGDYSLKFDTFRIPPENVYSKEFLAAIQQENRRSKR
jgi:hypothetical protein